MRLNTLLFGPTERSTFFFRLLVVCLSALAFVPFSPGADVEIALIWGGYLSLAGLLLVRRRPIGSRLALLAAAVDVAAVTSLATFAPQGAPPLWPLYLFPFAAAALAGAPSVVFAAIMGTVSWSALAWANSESDWLQVAWQIALLISAAGSILVLSSRWAVERRQRHVWQDAAVGAHMLWTGDDPGTVAASIVDTLVKLAGAKHSWLLRPGLDGRVRLAAKSGSAPETEHPGDAVIEALGNSSAAVLTDDTWVRSIGGTVKEAVALRSQSTLAGVLVLVWDELPRDAEARRTAVRSLSDGAAEALLAADRRAALQNELALENALRMVAGAVASTLDASAVRSAVAAIASTALGARVSIKSAEAIVSEDASAEVIVPLAGGTGSMMVWREEVPFSKREMAWLQGVASVVETGLARCEDHSALRAEEQRLRAALEALPAPAFVAGPDGKLLLSNLAYRSVCESARNLEPEVVQTPGTEEELTVGDPPRTFAVSTVPVGDTAYTVTFFREVTREREALRAKDELMAMAGHELRSPLTSISGYSQMMAKQLSVVQRQIGQLDQLIGDFMEASRFDDAHLSLDIETMDVGELARVAAERFVGSHPSRPLRLQIGEVPDIEGDPTRLGQVLDNLLSNANKYSPMEDSEIELGTATKDSHVLIWVRDHGLGIEPEHLPLLFQRFYRVRTNETQGVKGLGLGLSIVRDLVAAHRGTVWAESAGKAQGSTFWIKLPVSTRLTEPEASLLKTG